MSAISNQNAKHLTNFSRADQTINVKQHVKIHTIPSSLCKPETERVTEQPCVFSNRKERRALKRSLSDSEGGNII